MLTMNDQIFLIIGYFVFLPFLSLIFFITCTKSRPSKDVHSKNDKRTTAILVPEDTDQLQQQPTPTPNSSAVVSSNEVAKQQRDQQHEAQESSHRKKAKIHLQQQQQPSASGAKSKEIVEIQTEKKNSNEKISSADENQKKSNFKAASGELVKQSEHVDAELRKQKNLTTTTVTKGSHELTTATANSKRKRKRSKRVMSEYDQNRGHTPATTDDDKHATVSKVDFQRTNPGTDDEGLFKKPTDADETVEEKNKNQPQPQKFQKNEKEKKIDAGLKKKASDYPTMADVVSDWTSEKEVDGKKKDKGKSKRPGKGSGSARHHNEKKAPAVAAAAAAKGSVRATK